MKDGRIKDHKIKMGSRSIPESICNQIGCEFYGKPAKQGICFSVLAKSTSSYIDSVRKRADDCLKEMKGLRKVNKLETDAKWIRYMESHFTCAWMNSEFTLDQLIHLRATIAKLEAKVARLSKTQKEV